jgi:hypothetical protein
MEIRGISPFAPKLAFGQATDPERVHRLYHQQGEQLRDELQAGLENQRIYVSVALDPWSLGLSLSVHPGVSIQELQRALEDIRGAGPWQHNWESFTRNVAVTNPGSFDYKGLNVQVFARQA